VPVPVVRTHLVEPLQLSVLAATLRSCLGKNGFSYNR
jgi:hypothetical protein